MASENDAGYKFKGNLREAKKKEGKISMSWNMKWKQLLRYWCRNCLKLSTFCFDPRCALLWPPFLKSSTIKKTVQKLLELKHFESLRAVTECDQHPAKMWSINQETLLPLFPFKNDSGIDYHSSQKASLPKVYAQTAALDLSKFLVLNKYKSISSPLMTYMIHDFPENFDVNTPSDWKFMLQLAPDYLLDSLS